MYRTGLADGTIIGVIFTADSAGLRDIFTCSDDGRGSISRGTGFKTGEYDTLQSCIHQVIRSDIS
jgi:hypothetical protein